MYFLHQRIVVAHGFYAAALAKNEADLNDWRRRPEKNTEALEKLLGKKLKLEKKYKEISAFIRMT